METTAIVQEILKAERFDVPVRSETVPVLVFPKDREAHGLAQIINEFEKTQPAPYRRKGTYLAADIPSLIAWMALHTDEHAPVFAAGIEKPGEWRKPSLSLIGIGNYSGGTSAPAWHDFRARYEFPVSEQWAVWAKKHEESLAQADFAEFIEDRIYDLSSPKSSEKLPESVTRFLENADGTKAATPSQIFELSRGLKLTSTSKLEEKLNLSSGETTLRFTEEHTGAGGHPIKVPNLFYIRIPVFFGMAPVLVGCRLRYRLSGGAVRWSYSLFAPEMVVAEQFSAAVETLRKAKRTVFLGSPD